MDFVQSALTRAPDHDALSFLLAFAAGVTTSVGPCAAPRYLAIAGMASGRTIYEQARQCLAFVFGILCAYSVIAVFGSVMSRLVSVSASLNIGLAIALGAFGVRALWHAGEDECYVTRSVEVSAGGAFSLGALSSLVISPCCAPVLLGLGALGAGSPDPSATIGLVAAFTVGHVIPVLFVFRATTWVSEAFHRYKYAVTTVNAGVLIALAGYYAVLA